MAKGVARACNGCRWGNDGMIFQKSWKAAPLFAHIADSPDSSSPRTRLCLSHHQKDFRTTTTGYKCTELTSNTRLRSSWFNAPTKNNKKLNRLLTSQDLKKQTARCKKRLRIISKTKRERPHNNKNHVTVGCPPLLVLKSLLPRARAGPNRVRQLENESIFVCAC